MTADDPTTRIFPFKEMLRFRENAKLEGKRIVLTNGCFDLLHRGHISYLQKSASLGDLLVVAVNSDESVRALKGDGRPLNQENDRAYALASLRCVDAVFVFRGPRLAGEIGDLKPDLYTKAGDYTLDSLEPSEKAALLECGCEIHLIPFIQGHSTTSLIERSRENAPPQSE
jgi:rfaE bifunctional protein nucleotidyltransferase chain/domain